MEVSQLLKGLNPRSLVAPAMLGQLTEEYKKQIPRACSNDNWTEQTEKDFELIRAIIHGNGGDLCRTMY